MSGPLTQALAIFLVLAAGWAAGKLGFFPVETRKGVSAFIANMGFPAVIVLSMQRPFEPALVGDIAILVAVAAFAYAIPIGLSSLFPRRGVSPERRGVYRFAFCFPNVGFLGFPVVTSILGDDALFMASIFNIPFQVLAFSVGAEMVARQESREGASGARPEARGILPRLMSAAAKYLTPSLAAAIVGLALFAFSVTIPEPLKSGMELVGSTTTPLSMIVIGATLSDSSLRKAFGDYRVWLLSAWRLAVFPAALWAALFFMGFRGEKLVLPTILMAMPVAANSTILAQTGGGDAEGASALVFASTALSLITIPLLALVFGG